MKIGRVIARPFVGRSAADFARTSHRKDFAIPPPAGNLFERAAHAGRDIVSVGKIGDIFAHSHTGREVKGATNAAHVDLALEALTATADGGLIFVNLADFDTEYGHRRDVFRLATPLCLEAFDRRLPEIMARMRADDYCVITADHGNDPTWRGYDHTREYVPILGFGGGAPAGADQPARNPCQISPRRWPVEAQVAGPARMARGGTNERLRAGSAPSPPIRSRSATCSLCAPAADGRRALPLAHRRAAAARIWRS